MPLSGVYVPAESSLPLDLDPETKYKPVDFRLPHHLWQVQFHQSVPHYMQYVTLEGLSHV